MAKVNVQARGCEINADLQAHIEEKMDHIERLWPRSDEAQLRVSQERGRFAAEITLVTGGMVTRGEERASDLRQAIDNAIEKLESQLRRYKEKVVARARRHDNRDVAGEIIHAKMGASGLASDGISTNAASTNNGASPAEEAHAEQVVRVKKFALKPMSAEEASLQMGLLGHNFFVFRDAENNQVSVVYRRRDGGYGLIEPVAD